MKKSLALMLGICFILAMVAGCTTPTTAAAVKTGLAVISSLSKSTDATADAEGLAEADSTVIAVLVDKNGVIVSCMIDAVQPKVNFTNAGEITTALDTAFESKQELGDAYGMGAVSGIGKEWNEQANAFAAYVVGKTVEQVEGIAVTEDGYAADTELAASVTVHVTDFIEGVAKAVANAQDLGAKEGDTLGMGIESTISRSTDATADAEGLAEAYNYYAATSFDADGVITSCVLDASQGRVNFDATGMISTDLTVAPMTKNELGDDYGMKAASGIGKEWYEQAASFADYVIGKTAAEVDDIAVSEEGYATDAELTSSVTVHVVDFITVIDECAANAK